MTSATREAHVIGSGPNGLAAAVRLASAGLAVTLHEGDDVLGGGLRSAELTLPGFVHDLCSAVHPLGIASPYLSRLPLARHGLRWLHPEVPLAHPLDDGTAVAVHRSIEETARGLGADGRAYASLMSPLAASADVLLPVLLGPIRPTRHLVPLARFGLAGVQSAETFANRTFRGERARALFAGNAAHSFLRLDAPLSAAYGLLLGMLTHVAGWPVAAGGSQAIADALASQFRSLGGRIVTGRYVRNLGSLPENATVLFDTAPPDAARIAGDRLPAAFRDRLANHPYNAAAFKVDWALDGPIPWTANACRRAGTVHVGGTFAEIAESERLVAMGACPERPFVLVAQQSLADPSRAPSGKQTGWAYCHVPLGSEVDMTDRIEAQIERFAPGFRGRILARRSWFPADFERWNPNEIGGAVNGGAGDLRVLIGQTLARPSPYATPDPGLFICSASTPPGGGVHGMCGFHAAEAALRSRHRRRAGV